MFTFALSICVNVPCEDAQLLISTAIPSIDSLKALQINANSQKIGILETPYSSVSNCLDCSRIHSDSVANSSALQVTAHNVLFSYVQRCESQNIESSVVYGLETSSSISNSIIYNISGTVATITARNSILYCSNCKIANLSMTNSKMVAWDVLVDNINALVSSTANFAIAGHIPLVGMLASSRLEVTASSYPFLYLLDVDSSDIIINYATSDNSAVFLADVVASLRGTRVEIKLVLLYPVGRLFFSAAIKSATDSAILWNVTQYGIGDLLIASAQLLEYSANCVAEASIACAACAGKYVEQNGLCLRKLSINNYTVYYATCRNYQFSLPETSFPVLRLLRYNSAFPYATGSALQCPNDAVNLNSYECIDVVEQVSLGRKSNAHLFIALACVFAVLVVLNVALSVIFSAKSASIGSQVSSTKACSSGKMTLPFESFSAQQSTPISKMSIKLYLSEFLEESTTDDVVFMEDNMRGQLNCRRVRLSDRYQRELLHAKK